MQPALGTHGFEFFCKPRYRDTFLMKMSEAVPSAERVARIHRLQSWLNLSDSAVEEALHEATRRLAFVGIDLNREVELNQTTAMRLGIR